MQGPGVLSCMHPLSSLQTDLLCSARGQISMARPDKQSTHSLIPILQECSALVLIKLCRNSSACMANEPSAAPVCEDAGTERLAEQQGVSLGFLVQLMYEAYPTWQ